MKKFILDFSLYVIVKANDNIIGEFDPMFKSYEEAVKALEKYDEGYNIININSVIAE